MPVPVIVGSITAILIPVILFLAFSSSRGRKRVLRAQKDGQKVWWSLRPQKKVRNYSTGEVEPKNEEVDFEPRHGHYMKCGEIVITLASASLVFIPTLHFTATLSWLGLPMVLLGFTIVYALVFIGLLTYFYELELQNPDNFTAVSHRHCSAWDLLRLVVLQWRI